MLKKNHEHKDQYIRTGGNDSFLSASGPNPQSNRGDSTMKSEEAWCKMKMKRQVEVKTWVMVKVNEFEVMVKV